MDEMICLKCTAHGAPDVCWNCGRKKKALRNDYGRMIPADPLPERHRVAA